MLGIYIGFILFYVFSFNMVVQFTSKFEVFLASYATIIGYLMELLFVLTKNLFAIRVKTAQIAIYFWLMSNFYMFFQLLICLRSIKAFIAFEFVFMQRFMIA